MRLLTQDTHTPSQRATISHEADEPSVNCKLVIKPSTATYLSLHPQRTPPQPQAPGSGRRFTRSDGLQNKMYAALYITITSQPVVVYTTLVHSPSSVSKLPLWHLAKYSHHSYLVHAATASCTHDEADTAVIADRSIIAVAVCLALV